MDMQTPLCVLPPPPPAGCCDPVDPPPAAPLLPTNLPGLPAIGYRIGTFTSFRRAMLDAVARPDLLAGLPGNPPNPFMSWHEGSSADYQSMLIELWAYLADILTFYQERIANEAYLPTATQRDSLQRLAQLIYYQPSPGAGANAQLALSVEPRKVVSVPAGFRAGSKATPGNPPATFETQAAITARGEHSAIPLSAVAPTNQFAPLSDYAALIARTIVDFNLLATIAVRVYTGGATYLPTLLFGLAQAIFNPVSAARTVVLDGVNTRLAAADYVLVVEHEGVTGSENMTLQQITQVTVDKAAKTTTITWTESPPTSYQNVTLHTLRVSAGAFGNTASNWQALPATLTNSDGNNPNAPYQHDWDKSSYDEYFLPNSSKILLDGIYAGARGTSDRPGWVVLLADGSSNVYHLTDARPISATGYAMASKVTQITLGNTELVTSRTYPVRSTLVLTGDEPLTLQNNLPLPDPLAGNTLILAGLYPHLQAGQSVIVQGNLYDPSTTTPSQTPSAESGILAGPPGLDPANNLTTVTLKQALARQYARAGAVLLANMVDATQGETVKDEVLGSGDGSAFQAFPLKQKPLTYLPSTDAEGLAAVTSTLRVSVNGVRWNERPTLLESAANAPDFTTSLDDSGQTTVTFGDGLDGARPPTGKDNVHAAYRKGLGASGNVAAGAIAQLIDSMPGLQKVTNPLPSLGGADRASAEQIRANAPASLRTFNRAVSAVDYAALALSYPGVAKASAAWVLRDATTLLAIPQPYIQLTVATANQAPLAQQPSFARRLRSFLDKRRDPNVPLRILDYTPVYIDVAATIDLLDNYPRQGTLLAAQAALNPGLNPDRTPGYFAFERMNFGESIHLSAVYAALQAVDGVRDATITTLRRPDRDTDRSTVRTDIFIRPTELALVNPDPADRSSKVTITLGTGGFADV